MELLCRSSFSSAELGFCKTVEKASHPAAVTSLLLLRRSSLSLQLFVRAFAIELTVSSFIPHEERHRFSNTVCGLSRINEKAVHPIFVISQLAERSKLLSDLLLISECAREIGTSSLKPVLSRWSSSNLQFGLRRNSNRDLERATVISRQQLRSRALRVLLFVKKSARESPAASLILFSCKNSFSNMQTGFFKVTKIVLHPISVMKGFLLRSSSFNVLFSVRPVAKTTTLSSSISLSASTNT
mmetsp:Transcript_31998/g.59137  ORF Transcript_31998/g.59137 Transcript_31998/m.59137 type:complete len:242 (-) Transcript_31998:71-796(-)